MTAPAVVALLLPMYALVLAALRRSRSGGRRVERQLGELRSDIAGCRAAHDALTTSLDRRLDGLEQTTARAANELRMASQAIIHPSDAESTRESRR